MERRSPTRTGWEGKDRAGPEVGALSRSQGRLARTGAPHSAAERDTQPPLPLNQAPLQEDTDLLPLPVRHERGEGWGEGYPSCADNPPLLGPLLPGWEERERSPPLSHRMAEGGRTLGEGKFQCAAEESS